jgi:predicted metal-dependent hydrolase
MEKVQFQIAKNKSLEVELIRKNVKNINLTIRPDLSITLSANQNISEETIREYLQKKSEWLMKRMGKYQQTKSENIVEREYVSGESYKFLGKQYRLLVEFIHQPREYSFRMDICLSMCMKREKTPPKLGCLTIGIGKGL